MNTTHSPLSPIMMITALETIQSLLENYPCSLSDYEKTALTKFATSVAESMESSPVALITILPYSTSPAVSMGLQERRRLRVAHAALSSLIPGTWARYCLGGWSNPQPPTSPDMFQKNGLEQTTLTGDTHPSPECPSDPE